MPSGLGFLLKDVRSEPLAFKSIAVDKITTGAKLIRFYLAEF
jgi:hypothetical protein